MRSMLPESTPLLVAACVILAVATGVVAPTYLYFADACFCPRCRRRSAQVCVFIAGYPIDCISMVGWRQSDMPERQIRYPRCVFADAHLYGLRHDKTNRRFHSDKGHAVDAYTM